MSVINAGNLFGNKIFGLGVPVSSEFSVVSSVDYNTLDLNPEMDSSLKAIIENP